MYGHTAPRIATVARIWPVSRSCATGRTVATGFRPRSTHAATGSARFAGRQAEFVDSLRASASRRCRSPRTSATTHLNICSLEPRKTTARRAIPPKSRTRCRATAASRGRRGCKSLIDWSGRKDSNLRPPAPHAAAQSHFFNALPAFCLPLYAWQRTHWRSFPEAR
jgi:hypothetical protein